MPRSQTSSMTSNEFRFLRDLLGLTQQDVANLTGVSSPRVVAAWDSERNPSVSAAAIIRERYSWFQRQLTGALNSPLPARTTDDGETVIELRRYSSDDELHEDHPEYQRIRHYDAFLRALTAALLGRGAIVKIID